VSIKSSRAQIPVVIPSLSPRPSLLAYIGELKAQGFTKIVLVDDGSGSAFSKIFEEAQREHGCEVLTHPVNLGKGAALKSAFAHIAKNPNHVGVVTADADGQHSALDVAKVADALLENDLASKKGLILGTRTFGIKGVPWKSRFGNNLTSLLVKMLFGKFISDTQTGLRGIPAILLESQQEIRGDRFEYEMGALFSALTNKVPIIEIPIKTIYPDGENKETHFRPLVDSAKIYFVIFGQFMGFASSSFLSALVDIALFVFIIDTFFEGSADPRSVITSVVLARLGSSLLNFSLNKGLVFSSQEQKRRTLIRYYLLAVSILSLSAAGSAIMAQVLDGRVVWAKLLVDSVLFVLSYLIQRRWVFKIESGRTK
jgi:glycosyltransferase involved in cell wall biosynthesis